MNVKLLRKIAKYILAEPKRLYMSSYIHTKEQGAHVIERPFAKCGTVACIAGWACILTIKRPPLEIWREFSIGDEAKDILGLSTKEAFRLFEPGAWPVEFSSGTSDDGKLNTAKVAIARINHFIRTKGKE